MDPIIGCAKMIPRRKLPAAVAAGSTTLLLLGILSGCKPDNKYVAPPPAAVTVAHPEARNITRYYETSGTTAAINQTDLVARVQGFLISQSYTDGQAVTKGTVLFTIEPQPYQAKLQQAQAQEAASQAQAAQTDAEYNRDAALARINLPREARWIWRGQRAIAIMPMCCRRRRIPNLRRSISDTRR